MRALALAKLQLAYLIAQLLNRVGLHQRAGLLALRVYRGGYRAGLPVGLRREVSYGRLRLAAAVRQLHLNVAPLAGYGIVKGVSTIAGAVAYALQRGVKPLELLAIKYFLLAGRHGVLAVIALAIAPQVAAAHKDKKEKDDNPPCAAAESVVAVALGRRADVREAVVARIHSNPSYIWIYICIRRARIGGIRLLEQAAKFLCHLF